MNREAVALVTGAGSGIGEACAEKLARDGYYVAVADVDLAKADRVSHAIGAAGGRAMPVLMDVSVSDLVEQAVRQVVTQIGPPEVLVNNAGIVWQSPLEDVTDDEWQRVLGVNLTGAFYTARAVIPHLRRAGHAGRIVNISSVLSTVTRPLNGPYSASKGGLNALTRTLALELGSTGVTVNAVAPGHIRTPLTAPMFTPAVARAFEARIPLGVLGEPEWVADVVGFLVSPAARYITGQVLFVDGGYNINGDLPGVEFGR